MKRIKKRGNGQGSAFKEGKTWRAQVTSYSAGRRLTASHSGFKTKRDALEWCILNRPETKSEALRTFSEVYL